MQTLNITILEITAVSLHVGTMNVFVFHVI